MPEQKIERIAIFIIDCLYSNAALNKLVEQYKEKVVLICNSKRYGGKYGSFWHQLMKVNREQGLHFSDFMTFLLEFYKLFIPIGAIVNGLLRRPRKIYSMREIARRYHAKLVQTRDINSPEMIDLLKQTQLGNL